MYLYLANSGIPLFSQSVFYQVLLLLPIIAIEAFIHTKILGIPARKASLMALSTNFISTMGGGLLLLLPLGAFLGNLLLGSSVPVQPGSFPLLPIEIMVTLIPMFFFSVALEYGIGLLSLKKIDRVKVRRSFFIANAYTYLMLETLAFSQLIKGYIEGRG